MKNLENLHHQKLNQKTGKSKRYLSAENVNVSNMGNHIKGVLKRPILQKSKPRHDVSHHHSVHRGQSHSQLQDEEDYHEQEHEAMESFSPHQVRGKRLAESKRKHDVSHRHSVHRRQSYSQLQHEEDNHEQEHETMESFSPHLVRGRQLHDSSVKITSQYGEEYLEEDGHEVDSLQTESDTGDLQPDENIGSTSHGTRKESRALTQTRKRRSSNGKLIFEVDECMRRIVGDDSQLFITKGGCVMREHALFDGTTWKKHSSLLKADIITKCTENSTFDPSSGMMVHAMDTQLANQHRNKQHRLHKYYKTFPTKEEALTHPPKGIKVSEWVNLCERFTSQDFQKISVRNMKNRSCNKVPPAEEKQIQMQEEHGQMKGRMEFMMKELSRLSRLQSKKTA